VLICFFSITKKFGKALFFSLILRFPLEIIVIFPSPISPFILVFSQNTTAIIKILNNKLHAIYRPFRQQQIQRSRINFLSSPASYSRVVAMKTISQKSFVARDYLPAVTCNLFNKLP